jgi:hypothetical protein
MMVSRMIQIIVPTQLTRDRRTPTPQEAMAQEIPVSVKVISIAMVMWMQLM